MHTSLHITNGDSTTKNLQQFIQQDIIITWREMLSEGKTLTEVGSETFWKTRLDFLQSSYKISKRNFIDFTLKEYRNLCNQKQQDEIVLWFDGDLFSQINMLGVISWLKRYRKGRKISCVQVNSKNDTAKKIAKLTSNQLSNHFKKRVELTKDDIEYADYVWQLYCSDCPLRLQTIYKFNKSAIFNNLEKAIATHLLRFPSIKTGLNEIETSILHTVHKEDFKNKEQLVNSLIKNQPSYGFNELQYNLTLEELKKLFSSFTPIQLNKIGKNILENQLNYYGKMRSEFSYLGGAKKYSFLHVSTTNKLLKISS